ncbi:MAG: hypothetical protein J7641_09365 [Cyanobacteria bacterium SID2]|nr:hypothetical protein [Cyanobacteria bacterium SID2]MBP0005823.1 hypothetical protein [Cyanobacteria bacterium SBC]
MSGLFLGLAITVFVLIIVGGSLFVFFSTFFNWMERTGLERMQEQFTSAQIVRSDVKANFFGLQSRGNFQIRGNGVLVLTREELWFSRLVKREDISIPLNTIEQVDLVNSHLGKRILGRQLLYVQFASSDGTDAGAWLVNNPQQWQQDISSIVR